jgi:hypothetical protein
MLSLGSKWSPYACSYFLKSRTILSVTYFGRASFDFSSYPLSKTEEVVIPSKQGRVF